MSLDQFASANDDPTKPRPKPAAAAPVETDEDLFNFDELLGAKKQSEALNKELDAVLDAVDAAKVDVAATVAPAPASVAAPAPAPAPIKPVAGPAPVAPTTAATVGPTIQQTVVHQKLSISPVAAALLVGVVLVNVTLMIFAWSSVSAVKQLVLDVGHDVADTTTELKSESTHRNREAAFESQPVFGALPEGYRTLEIARERMERGEHARARRMLYGLLSVIDRIDQPARSEVEAQAGFLIADSYRIEADSMHGGAQ